MFITSNPEVATIAMNNSVDRIFVDMETIGKNNRQGGLDTVQSSHTLDDIKCIKKVMMPDKELLVRSNPIYSSSKEEIEQIIQCGADIVMLPYFQTADEVRKFVSYVGGKAKVCLLIESKGAVENLDEILAVNGVDEYFIGLNDLHLDYKMKFMFEPLTSGLLHSICTKIKNTGKSFGFGGVAQIGQGLILGERVIMEHYRLQSSSVIVSRGFCNTSVITNLDEIGSILKIELGKVRDFEQSITKMDIDCDMFRENYSEIQKIVKQIVNG